MGLNEVTLFNVKKKTGKGGNEVKLNANRTSSSFSSPPCALCPLDKSHAIVQICIHGPTSINCSFFRIKFCEFGTNVLSAWEVPKAHLLV